MSGMSGIKVEIWATYGHGAWGVTFKKHFILPAPPFIGLIIHDSHNEEEMDINLYEGRYSQVTIGYQVKEKSYLVNINSKVLNPSSESIGDIIEEYIMMGWETITSEKEIDKYLEYLKSKESASGCGVMGCINQECDGENHIWGENGRGPW